MVVTLSMARRLEIRDPPKNWALTIARDIERGNPLDHAIIERLVGHPRRYAELQPLLHGRGKNNLTQALKRLQLAGVVHMRTDVLAEPPVDHYELSGLGAQVAMVLAGREYFEYVSSQAGRAPPRGPTRSHVEYFSSNR